MAITPPLALYFAPGSSSMAPHIALHEVDAPFEARPVSFRRGEHRSPAFLALNPEGKVPVLLVDGRPLTEVAAILFWLARRFPEGRLWPEGDAEEEARAISWMSFIASTVHPAWRQGLEAASRAFEAADRRLGLGPGPWALSGYSVADIHLFRLYWRFRGRVGERDASAAAPNLEAHFERMMERPAVRRTISVEAAIGYELPG